MEIITDVEEAGEEIKRCISRFGHAAEHNYAYLLAVSEDAKTIFLKSSEGYGALAALMDNTVTFYCEAFAPREAQTGFLLEAMNECSKKLGTKKFVVQQDEKLRQETLSAIKKTGYRPVHPRYSFYWPVFDMSKWSGDTLSGDEWKKLRNIRNKFQSEHSLEVVDSASLSKEQLNAIIKEWIYRRRLMSIGANRENSNFIYYKQYFKLVDSGIENLTLAKTLVIDGKPRTITAGWEVPNSDRWYYSGIGICDYSIEGLGEIANLQDLCTLKERGYRFVEFGGSTLPLLRFKLKFRPHFAYLTHTYSIVKR